jgi:hypothetical protein
MAMSGINSGGGAEIDANRHAGAAPPSGLTLSAETNVAAHLSMSPKTAGLVELKQLGLPTPPAYALHAPLLVKLHRKGRSFTLIEAAIAELEYESGVELGSPMTPGCPLLLTVRAGSKRHTSFPPSLIYIGASDKAPLSPSRRTDRQAQLARFEAAIGRAGLFSDLPRLRPREQVVTSVLSMAEAVAARGPGHDPWITLQQTRFGDSTRASCSGMAYSRNPHTGNTDDFGRFMTCASGVRYSHSAISERQPLETLAKIRPQVHRKLRHALAQLDAHYKAPRYVEFVVENDTLFFVQNMASRHPWPSSAVVD